MNIYFMNNYLFAFFIAALRIKKTLEGARSIHSFVPLCLKDNSKTLRKRTFGKFFS